MGTLSAVREQEITQILAPWLRAKVENGLLKVWLAENAPEHVKEILESKDRRKSAPKASADGLTLVEICYENLE